jgi:hypothetical protein
MDQPLHFSTLTRIALTLLEAGLVSSLFARYPIAGVQTRTNGS